ncbi:Shiga toxin A subunit [Rosenbergiella australiborealis]|uniref:Shiga toxin A subunit n=1 Tax=Rosenbergiella australiborealis TaxID=1544696 RepID=A0ABS5T175_9GAMM|nr:Shiga toxin A subunit [Rosenbergiella australiborealis]MBT0725922.1 Shiga toxin A subunit [Rosenbergiella australiborealis]
MKKIIGLFLVVLSTQSVASNDVGCAKVGASMYIGLTDAIVEDLNISRNQIIQKNVSVDVLSVLPITKVYAEQLAKEDYKKLNTHILSLDNYIEGYSTDNTEVIIAKYTYRNEKNQKNIFITSSLQNKYECSVRFNGYLTIEREF